MTTSLAATLFSNSVRVGDRFAARALPVPQPRALRTVIDVSEFFGETSGGVRTYLAEKAEYVERSSHIRASIVLPGPRDTIRQSERVRCYRLASFPVPGQAPYRLMLDVATTRRILEHERPDVVEIGSSLLAPWHVIATCRRLGIPLVSFFHSHVPRLVGGPSAKPSVVRKAGASLAWRYLRRLDRTFDRTIVSSRYAERELASQGIERTTYVPLGVDLAQFNPDRRASGEMLLEQLGVSRRPVVLFVGRFAREKRLDLLLQAWSDIEARTGGTLVLAGDGPHRRRLMARHGQPSVRWVGYVRGRPDVARLMAAADVVVCPGEAETFGLATLEALSCGTPVLAADDGGSAELVWESGGGLLFESGSAASLAHSLERILELPRAPMADAGRRYAERHHGWDTVFGSLFRTYDDAIGSAR